MKTLTAFYDLAYGPVSYDFVTWLVRAMQERDARQCERLHVVIVPKDDGLGGFSRHWGEHDEADTRWRLWHIVMASVPLARASVTLAPCRQFALDLAPSPPMGDKGTLTCTRKGCEAEQRAGVRWWPEGKAHFMGPLVDAARKGESIPRLQASAHARRIVEKWIVRRPFVTLTRRQLHRDTARNSDPAAWSALADAAAQAGYPVFDLADTTAELLGFRGAFAALDIDLRLALYEAAAMNFCANTGPQELLKFSHAPYRAFDQALGGWAEHFEKHFHMQVGQQLPWAAPDHRLVYERATAAVLLREFAAWHSQASRTQEAGCGIED